MTFLKRYAVVLIVAILAALSGAMFSATAQADVARPHPPGPWSSGAWSRDYVSNYQARYVTRPGYVPQVTNNIQTGGANATGTAIGSPGIGSGNVIQRPVNAPTNICGNNIGTVRSPSIGNYCSTG